MRIVAISTVVLLAGCEGLVQVNLDIERLCVSRPAAISVPALPRGGSVTVSGAITAPASQGLDLEVRFESLEFTNPVGAADFAFLEDAAVFSAGSTEHPDPIPLATLRKSAPGAPPSARLVSLVDEQAPATGGDRLDYLLSLTLGAVAAPVTADVQICAKVLGRYTAL